jgi:hypothetical protein
MRWHSAACPTLRLRLGSLYAASCTCSFAEKAWMGEWRVRVPPAPPSDMPSGSALAGRAAADMGRCAWPANCSVLLKGEPKKTWINTPQQTPARWGTARAVPCRAVPCHTHLVYMARPASTGGAPVVSGSAVAFRRAPPGLGRWPSTSTMSCGDGPRSCQNNVLLVW